MLSDISTILKLKEAYSTIYHMILLTTSIYFANIAGIIPTFDKEYGVCKVVEQDSPLTQI